MSNKIEDQAWRIAEPFLLQNDCRLWDVVFEKEGAMHYLRILFDRQSAPLDMETCERLTPPLNKLIDEGEFIKKGLVDIVEVGSPGVSRRVRRKEHFDYCMGEKVSVMRRLDNGKTEVVTGILNGYNQGEKTIVLDSEELSLKKCLRITFTRNEEIPQ